VLVACALVVTTVVIYRGLEPDNPTAGMPAHWVPNAHALDVTERHLQGSKDAPTLILFSDYQCPFCAQLDHSIDSLVSSKYGDSVALLVRHFPIEQLHPMARRAAIAAECARRAGRGMEYHRMLFATHKAISDTIFVPLASSMGIEDTLGFKRCLSSEDAARIVREDTDAGRRLGLRGTPLLVIGDSAFPGAMSASDLDARLARLLSVRPTTAK